MIKLSEIPTTAPSHFTKKETRKLTDQIARQVAELQHIMYAQNEHSLLVIFQGMDASGKDGATRKVFRYCSPAGVDSVAFKKPTEEEFAHDFLWRVHKHVPRKGRLNIFNRSHYEDVLIQRVHGWIDEDRVNDRINAINAFERSLVQDNNTTIVKFYMHISEARQKEKLTERVEVKEKNWKHNDSDWKERKHWSKYMECYEDVINRSEIPWVIAPVDQRWYRDYFIANHILQTLESLNLQLPDIDVKIPTDV